MKHRLARSAGSQTDQSVDIAAAFSMQKTRIAQRYLTWGFLRGTTKTGQTDRFKTPVTTLPANKW